MHYPVNVFTGKVREYDGSRPSAIAKVQVDGELTLTELGLAGDEQAEKKIHGGPERALCHYPREHYQYWITEFPEQADLFVAPAFGENLSTEGLTEKNVFIGDIFRWGDALIQVTQPRSPCFKLNFHFGINDMSARLQSAGKTGWLYRVVLAGQVSADAPLELVSRLSDVSVYDACAIAGICRLMTSSIIAFCRRQGYPPAGQERCRNAALVGRLRIIRGDCGGNSAPHPGPLPKGEGEKTAPSSPLSPLGRGLG